MKSCILYNSIRILLLGAVAALAPLNAAMAQSSYDPMQPDSPASTPSTSEEGTTTVTPSEMTSPPSQPEFRSPQDEQTTQPRGARGPIRYEMGQDSLRPTDQYREGMQDYERQLSKVFRGD